MQGLSIATIYLFLMIFTKCEHITMRKLSLRPPSVCCDVPELGDVKALEDCTNKSPLPPCEDIKCIYQVSGWLTNDQTLNKDAYKNYLLNWAKSNKDWEPVIHRVIKDCVDNEVKQYLDKQCKAYDIYTCTYLAFVKRCPDFAWKCSPSAGL